MSTIPMSMSLLRDNAIISPEISPASSPKSPDLSSPASSLKSPKSPKSPETPEPHSISNEKFDMVIRRISIATIWTIFMVVTNTTVMLGIAKFITSAAFCIGLFGAFVIITIPVVYAVDPETVSRFKFSSLAPSFTVGLYSLDYLVNRAVHYIKQKQF